MSMKSQLERVAPSNEQDDSYMLHGFYEDLTDEDADDDEEDDKASPPPYWSP